MNRIAIQHEVFLCRYGRQSCSARPQNFTRTMLRIVQKVNKKKRRSVGSLNRCAIQYEVSVCASHLPKHSHLVSATVDETFKLSDPLSVRNERNPYSAIAPLFCPRKTLSFKALRGVWGALSRKRPPRVPLVPAFPSFPRPPLVPPHCPRQLLITGSAGAAAL